MLTGFRPLMQLTIVEIFRFDVGCLPGSCEAHACTPFQAAVKRKDNAV
jgi:hypothetical protein